jgi:hypothetical protein
MKESYGKDSASHPDPESCVGGRKREIPQVPTGSVPAGRPGKAFGRPPGMHARGKSDDRVVPGKLSNKGEPLSPAEAVEGRQSTKGSPMLRAESQTQSWTDSLISWHRARGAALPHAVITRGRSRMRWLRTSGPARGDARKGVPYRDPID